MKFSFVNEQRREAQPGLSGQCPACGQATIAKCGEIKIWHWAHKGRRTCDPWWENETEWHRNWKGRFPESWQEVVHTAESGEKHIADVKTDQGWVIEFQHSYIKPDERQSRDDFYKKLVWVVDGARRKRDGTQFLNALNRGLQIGSSSLIRRMLSDKCALLREWVGSHVPVFFHFGGEQLWWMLKGNPDGSAYVAGFPVSEFMKIHLGGATQDVQNFEGFLEGLSDQVSQYESPLRVPALQQARTQPPQDPLRERLLRGYRPVRRRL